MIIVSGLPRSGTSLMMNILNKNNIRPLTDKKRKADIHNPKGYFEIKDIGKKLEKNPNFLEGKTGCVKVLSLFVNKIKGNHKIIFMERKLEEIFSSMEKMSGEKVLEKEKKSFKKHLEKIKKRLKSEKVVYINYNNLIKNPREELRKLKKFIPEIDINKSLGAIDSKLYRNKA